MGKLFEKKPCTWNGVQYSSLRAAAKAQGVTPLTMLRRLRCGYACDADMVGKRAVVWNGVQYETIAAAARANIISNEGMYYRLKRGYTSDAELRR